MADTAPAPNLTVVPSPATPAQSAVEAASEQARQRIAETGTALSGNDTDDNRSHHSTSQPRTEAGRFTEDARKEVGAGAITGDEEENTESSDQTDESDDQVEATNGDGESDDGEANAEESADEQDDDTAGEDDETDDELTVTLPSADGDEPFAITASDPETAEQLRRLTAGYMNGTQVRTAEQQLSHGFEQLEEFKDQLLTDPAGALLDLLPDDDATLEHIALYLLAQPAIWPRVAERVLSWDDQDKLELDTAKLTSQRYALREQWRTFAEDRREVQQNLRDVQRTVAALVPQDWPAERANAFARDALLDLKAYADRHQLKTLPVADIPLLLARRMAERGINPIEAATRMTIPQNRTAREDASTRRTVSRSAPNTNAKPAAEQPDASDKPDKKGKSGKQFVASAKKKQAVGRVPSSGAGAPSGTGLTPPLKDGKPMGIDDTIAWHRKQVATGKRLYR